MTSYKIESRRRWAAWWHIAFVFVWLTTGCGAANVNPSLSDTIEDSEPGADIARSKDGGNPTDSSVEEDTARFGDTHESPPPDVTQADTGPVEPPPVTVTPTDTGAWQATTLHYEVTAATDEIEAGIIAQLLEASWDDFLDVFDGATPGVSPLKVHIYATESDFKDNVKYPDGTPVNAAGYYDPNTEIASLIVQPSVYYTRSLALHEAAHQYHWLARLTPQGGPPTWYMEAVASWLQIYHWDGIETTLGVTALASLEDYPAQGFEDLKNTQDFAAVIAGQGPWTRPMGRLIFRYLQEKMPAEFTAFRSDVDAGLGDCLALFTKYFGEPAKVREDILAWAPSDQEVFDIIYIDWTHVDASTILAEAEPSILIFLASAQPLEAMTVSFESDDIEEKAGVLLAWDSPDQYTMAVVDTAGLLEVIAVNGGQWSWLDSVTLNATDRVEMEVNQGLLSVNGTDYGPYDIGPGNPGLMSWGSDILFSDITTQ